MELFSAFESSRADENLNCCLRISFWPDRSFKHLGILGSGKNLTELRIKRRGGLNVQCPWEAPGAVPKTGGLQSCSCQGGRVSREIGSLGNKTQGDS